MGAVRPGNDSVFYKGCGVRRDTWVPPYSRAFCRAGPVCPAGGDTAQDRRADRGIRSYEWDGGYGLPQPVCALASQ